MLRLRELEVIQLFRQPGGSEFALFCNEVIRASCWASGVPQSEISTTTRTDAKDGGVDTRVGRELTRDRSGYFEYRTIWQFKAADEANLKEADMPEEVGKAHARKCIEEGYAYRIVICAHLPDDKKSSLAEALVKAVREVNPAAPKPRVLSVGDMTAVANSFPAVVLQYRPSAAGLCLLFDRWAEMVKRITKTFIPLSTFESMKSRVLAHSDFANDVDDPVIALHGQSGVGKTRAVYECFREQPGAGGMVLYSDNEEAAVDNLATMLVNDEPAHAIIVVDECSLSTRVRLSRKLAGCKNRIRCICIDNSTEIPAGAAPELVVSKPSLLELQKILEANFPSILRDRLRAYAELAEGFVRLAADMCCNYDERIIKAGDMGPIANKLEEYYRERLGGEDKMQAVEAIALLKRVKYKGESPTELDRLCDLTGVDRKSIEQHLNAIKDIPGFIERGELYYRVTPELIALIAFERGWKRWAEPNEQKFLESIPECLQESFFQRVSQGRSLEVRKTVQSFFRQFADSFEPRGLADLALVHRLIRIVEIDPEMYLPRVRQLVERATHEDLTDVSEWLLGSWGPRRQLVWLAERFIKFREFFQDCETILFTLAKHECEPKISNNATHIWQQIFRIHLSGTSLPFAVRLQLLRERVETATQEAADLVGGALAEILDFHGGRLLGPPVVSGRIVPPDWTPGPQEARDAVISGLKFIADTCQHPLPRIAQKARDVFIHGVESLARQGWVEQLKPIVAQALTNEDDRARLVAKLKSFVAWTKQSDGMRISEEYSDQLLMWIHELEPKSLHSRLIELIGEESWSYIGREEEWRASLKVIAKELLLDKMAFESEIEWLTSSDAKGAVEFGEELSSVDSNPELLDRILSASVNRSSAFARGYISGLLYVIRQDPKNVNVRLDAWEEQNPQFAFELALAGGEHVGVFDRVIRLIRERKIPAYQLRHFTHWAGRVRTGNEQVAEALEILVPYVEKNDEFCAEVLMDFLAACLHRKELQSLLLSDGDLVWKAIGVFTDHPGRQTSTYWWANILQALAPQNPTAGIQLACKGLVGENFEMSDIAANLLSLWSKDNAKEVMSAIGKLMLDPNVSTRFFVSKFSIFTALPVPVVTDWLSKAGLEGAQKIARHLPEPYLDVSGEPVVPELTAWVLSSFEKDDRVFSEFCAGVHSFQGYTGDIVAAHEAESEMARKFFKHPLPRIREWAQLEYESARANAARFRAWEDEMKP